MGACRAGPGPAGRVRRRVVLAAIAGGRGSARSADSLRPGPLRILFLVAAPIDQAQLDYEREEDAMLRATARLPGVARPVRRVGSFEELVELVAECRPHVVHLSGHGRMATDGQGTFAFEDERGRTDSRDRPPRSSPRSSAAARCNASSSTAARRRRRTRPASASRWCRRRIPLAVGWSASVADDRATDFTEEFYRRLVRGEPVPAAAAHARELIRRQRTDRASSRMRRSPCCRSIPRPPPAPSSTRAAGRKPTRVREPNYVLLGDGIKGLREGFVGRRRERQRLVPALRDGDTTFAVLTGIGGAGKSTLATRAANRLESAGFAVVPVRVEDSRGTAGSRADDADAGSSAGWTTPSSEAGRDDLHRQLTDGNLPRRAAAAAGRQGAERADAWSIVIDNFEDVLDLETRRIADRASPNSTDRWRPA